MLVLFAEERLGLFARNLSDGVDQEDLARPLEGFTLRRITTAAGIGEL